MWTPGLHMYAYMGTGSWMEVGLGTVEKSAENVQETYLFNSLENDYIHLF